VVLFLYSGRFVMSLFLANEGLCYKLEPIAMRRL
jgi:hypothetical protein